MQPATAELVESPAGCRLCSVARQPRCVSRAASQGIWRGTAVAAEAAAVSARNNNHHNNSGNHHEHQQRQRGARASVARATSAATSATRRATVGVSWRLRKEKKNEMRQRCRAFFPAKWR
eukprot:6443970-Heterocapsa_arctica.AAC.1